MKFQSKQIKITKNLLSTKITALRTTLKSAKIQIASLTKEKTKALVDNAKLSKIGAAEAKVIQTVKANAQKKISAVKAFSLKAIKLTNAKAKKAQSIAIAMLKKEKTTALKWNKAAIKAKTELAATIKKNEIQQKKEAAKEAAEMKKEAIENATRAAMQKAELTAEKKAAAQQAAFKSSVSKQLKNISKGVATNSTHLKKIAANKVIKLAGTQNGSAIKMFIHKN